MFPSSNSGYHESHLDLLAFCNTKVGVEELLTGPRRFGDGLKKRVRAVCYSKGEYGEEAARDIEGFE